MDPDVGWADLGVRLVVDPRSKGKIESEATGAMRQAGTSSGAAFGREAGDTATSELSASIKDWSKKGAVALGGGLGFAIGYGLKEGLDREQIGDVVAASLGLNARQQQQQGKVAGSLYAKAFGDSYAEVAEGVAAVTSSLPKLDGNGAIRRASADALNFAQVFGVDVPRNVQVARTIISSGLVKDAESAFDLMVRASQRVPQNVREDVLDAAEEYGQFFKTLGYDGQQAFSLLVANAGQGMYGIDKAGDAIKEFTIRATDGSKATATAYDLANVSMRQIETDILSGGDAAQKATQKVIEGLLDIEDPAIRANAAIALFGTPLEDLNVRKIPQFLRSLQGARGELKGVEGAADRMGDTLSDNVSTDITKMKRKLETDLVTFLSEKGLPALESFSDWMEDDGVPLLKDVTKYGGKAADAVGEMVGFLNDLPDPAKYAGLTTLVTGVAGAKLRGGKGGALGSVGSALGIAAPVKVFVTNPGFGSSSGPGFGVDVDSDGKDKDGKPRRGGKTAGALGLIASFFGPDIVNEVVAEATYPWREGPLKPDPSKESFDPRRQMGSEDLAAFLDAGEKKAQGFGRELDAIGSKRVEPFFAVPGLAKGRDGMAEFIRLQVEANKPVTAYIHTTQIERAIGLARTLKDELRDAALIERGVDGGATYQHGGTATTSRRHGHGGARRP